MGLSASEDLLNNSYPLPIFNALCLGLGSSPPAVSFSRSCEPNYAVLTSSRFLFPPINFGYSAPKSTGIAATPRTGSSTSPNPNSGAAIDRVTSLGNAECPPCLAAPRHRVFSLSGRLVATRPLLLLHYLLHPLSLPSSIRLRSQEHRARALATSRPRPLRAEPHPWRCRSAARFTGAM